MDEQIRSWVETERLGVADLFDELDDAEWQVASLCTDWTVHDVAAHLALATRSSIPGLIRSAVRARGSFDRMMSERARERSARFRPHELVAQLRATAGSPRRLPGAGVLDPLVDVLVHGQDVARPLGRRREVPAAPGIRALDYVRTSAFYGAPARFAGARLIATDADWTAGDGPAEIRGTLADLLLVATGRPAGLAGLAGSGVERVTARL